MDDKTLLEQSKRGDEKAFGALYDKYIRQIYTFVYYKTHHKETAEDLTSETFFKALKSINRADVDKPFSSWLYKIAQNTVIDHYRSKKNQAHADIDDVWDISDDTDIIGEIATKEALQNARKYLSKLGSYQRDIVIMRVWQELSYKEIADILGKNEGAIKVAFSRAVAELRKSMPLPLSLLFLLKL